MGNLKKIASALEVGSHGSAHVLKIRIELKLRELHFEDDTEFKPTAGDLQLSDEEFNNKFERERPYSISAMVRILAARVR